MESYILVFKNFGIQALFLATSLIIVGVFGWFIYAKVFLKNISLKNELFSKDSFSAWLDFTGAFLIPVLLLTSFILAPSGKFAFHGKWIDMFDIAMYTIFGIIVFTVFRFAAQILVSYMSYLEIRKKASLIKEIYESKNITAAIFSIAISAIAVSLMLQENFLMENILTNIIRLSFVLILTIGLLGIYKDYFYPSNSQLFKEIFIDRNPSIGIVLLGQIIAISIIINRSIAWLKISASGWLNIGYLIDLLLFVTFIYLIMIVIVSITKIILNFILKINVDKELLQENNVGYSFMESSFYIILSFMIINSFLV